MCGRTEARKITALGLLLVSGLARAADIGSITGENGSVSLERGGQTSTPLVGQGLRQGDVLNTGNDGRMELQLRDGSLISLSANTRFRVVQYDFDSKGKRPGLGLFDLLAGGVRGVTGAISRGDHRVELNTPVGTAGIRGTEFTTEIRDNTLDVAMLEGKGVYVRNPDGEQVEMNQPNQITQLPFERLDNGGYKVGHPSRPRQLLDEELKRMHEHIEWLDQEKAKAVHALRDKWEAIKQAHEKRVAARKAAKAAKAAQGKRGFL